MNGLIDTVRDQTEYLSFMKGSRFFRPDYERALSGVFPTIFEILDRPMEGYASLVHCLPDQSPRKAKRVLLFCIDSFGFDHLALSSRFRDLYPQYGTWLTSVFPTITSCALTSIYQGLSPGRHGITGHLIWKDSPGAVVDMLKMQVVGAEVQLNASGFDLNQWKREQGILESGCEGTCKGFHLMPEPIVNSGLSTYTYGHTRRIGYLNFLEGLEKAARMLTDIDLGWVGLYTPEIDTLTHVMGTTVPEVGQLTRHMETGLSRMAARLPRQVLEETVLVVVADHGQSNIQEKIAMEGEPMAWLEANTQAIGYSGRVMHLYTGKKDPGPVHRWMTDFIGDRGVVLTFEEALPLLGETPDKHFARQSLGDLVVLLHEGINWQKHPYDPLASPYSSQLVAQHGSLSWDELFIPFLVAPLSAMLME